MTAPKPVQDGASFHEHINYLGYLSRGVTCKKCVRCKQWRAYSEFDSVPSKLGRGRRRYAERCKRCEISANHRSADQPQAKRQTNAEMDYSKDCAKLPCLNCDIKTNCQTECSTYLQYVNSR